jgi:hypothetical protein
LEAFFDHICHILFLPQLQHLTVIVMAVNLESADILYIKCYSRKDKENGGA